MTPRETHHDIGRNVAALLCLIALCAADPQTTPAPQSVATSAPKLCSGCNFAGAQLAGSDLTKAVYVGVNFEGANLERISFRNARILAANFKDADLRGAAFDGAECLACNFEGAKLDGATFTGVQMLAANFKGFAASVDSQQLRGLLSGCMTCNFSGASLAGRDFSGITLISVDFSQADLRNTKFDGAVLCWYSVNGAQRTMACNKMADAIIEGASFRNVQICDNPWERQGCVPVDAATLRKQSGLPLSGTPP
jgi:uncharacterized protein YjbI with pentapeptide repeats